MIRVIEAKGDSIDAAIQNALNQLGCDRDEVSVEVVKKPKSGFFGFGKEPAVVKVTYQASPAGKAKDFLTGLLTRFGTPAHIEVTENEEEKTIHLELSGDNMGAIIGRRGDTLDAIQHLTNYSINREAGKHARVSVDAENYRQKREESLQRLAAKVAGKVVKYRRNITLEPMNAYERHVIHAALQETPGVTTYSTGTEPNRRIVVAYSRDKVVSQ